MPDIGVTPSRPWNQTPDRWVKPAYLMWAEYIVLLVAVVYFALHELPRAWATLNTDFPNYYLAAKLMHRGMDTSRMYEWTWIERQKDIQGIGVRVIGLLPITAFSTMFAWPLTSFSALTAKHLWIIANLALLIPMMWILHRLSGLGFRRIATIVFLSFPLYRNILYGQFYIVLLFLILAACLSYISGRKSLAAVLVAIAGVCKIFPFLLFAFFLGRREWRALGAGVATACGCTALSVFFYGAEAHRVWLMQILPWVMRGEGLGTYAITASYPSTFHNLLLNEPLWNPHPWHVWLAGYAILVPFLTTLTLAPALLLIQREDTSVPRVLLEWSSLITAALAISTIPASYNFVLMIFPVCVLAAVLLERRCFGWLATLIIAYLGIGYPLPVPAHVAGLKILLYIPRLFLMLVVLYGIYALQWKRMRLQSKPLDWVRGTLAIAVIVSLALNVRASFATQRGERTDYAHRLNLPAQGYANTLPQTVGDKVAFIRFGMEGYQLVAASQDQEAPLVFGEKANDLLSFTASTGNLLAERVGDGPEHNPVSSQIVDMLDHARIIEDNAHDPVLSLDGRDLAFLRDDHGRARLVLRPNFRSAESEKTLSPQAWNVYEASMLSPDRYAMAADDGNGSLRIYRWDKSHRLTAIAQVAVRYPAISPDGRWMAYSHQEHGFWNLWLRDEQSGESRRIDDVPCNQMQPSWKSDSKTLLYSTDCGRSLWFGAIAQRRVVP